MFMIAGFVGVIALFKSEQRLESKESGIPLRRIRQCVGCGKQLRRQSKYCDKCGLSTVKGAEALEQMVPLAKLQRDIDNLEMDKEGIRNDLEALRDELKDITAKIEKVLAGYFKQK
jgi:hypothetical protein